MESLQLLHNIISGDKKAEKQLVDEYQVKVYNICYGLVHNSYDAEDLTQEVFIEVILNAEKFRGDSKLGTWIYRIAVNRSLNFIRDNKKRKWWKQIDDLLSFNEESKNYPIVTENTMHDSEEKKVLQIAISKLPINQRVAFTLNKIDELSYKEVAEVMNLGHSAVESLIHRAKKNLQKLLINYYK